MTCTATGIAQAGQYANAATVIGSPPAGVDPPLPVTDPSHYFGANASVRVEKSTNGEDADSAPGPVIDVGVPVTWTYVVTNTGNEPLTDVTVVDNHLPSLDISCQADDNDHVIASLGVGEVVTCTAIGSAESGQYANVVTVTGTPPAGVNPPLPTTDPSHYFGVHASVEIEKSTNDADADLPPGPTIGVGDPVIWHYVVTNTGNEALTDVTVTDDRVPASDISCLEDDLDNVIDILNVGQVVTCTATSVASMGPYANMATVVGTPVVIVNPPVTTTDPSHYNGALAGLRIEKLTNCIDADVAPGPRIEVGEPVTWTYVVTNTGTVDLIVVEVTDDEVPAGSISCPVDNLDNVIDTLAVGQTVTCAASGTATAGQYSNTATVTGTPPVGVDPPLPVTDPSHYFGGQSIIGIPTLSGWMLLLMAILLAFSSWFQMYRKRRGRATNRN